MAKIIIIEDEKSIREELCLLLNNSGYTTVAIENFSNILQQVTAISPDLILLDVGLPEQSGYEQCYSAGVQHPNSICNQPRYLHG